MQFFKGILWTFFIFLLGFYAPTGILALETNEDKITDLGEVVITATRGEMPLEQTGSSIVVITREEIEAKQMRDVGEVLRMVPGLDVSQAGSRGSQTSVFSRGGESDHILVLIDGIQVNKAGGEFNFSQLSTENIERIEILRGSQSALYGSEAMTGVIQIFTQKGRGPLSITLSTSAGVRGEGHKTLFENRIALKREGLSLAYSRSDDPGILAFNNRFTRNTFSGRADFNPSEDVSLGLISRFEKQRNEFPTEGAGDRFDPLDPDQYLEEDHLTLGMTMEHRLHPNISQRLQIGITDQDRVSLDPSNPGRLCSGFSCDGISTSVFQSDEQRFTSDYLMNILIQPIAGLDSKTQLGVEYELEELVQTVASDFGFGASFDHSNVSRTNWAFYFQEQMGFWEHFFVTGGVRIESNSLFGTDVNSSGSFALLLKESGTKIRGSIGTGIKNPKFVEQFGSSFSVGNPNLTPEESLSWDLGLDQSLGAWGNLEVTYFANELDDLIAFIFDPFNDPNPDYFNIRGAKSNGVEIAIKVNPLDNLLMKGGVTFLSTKVTDDGGISSVDFLEGSGLLRRPHLKANWEVIYSLGSLTLGVGGRFVGERDDLDFSGFPTARVKNPSYVVWDGHFSYLISDVLGWVDEVKWFGRFSNLFDHKYEEVYGFSSPRFLYVGGVETTF